MIDFNLPVAVDLLVDGQIVRVEGRSAIPDGQSVDMVQTPDGLRVTLHTRRQGNLRRTRVEVESLGGPPRLLTGAHYHMPAFLLGNPDDCLLQAPGQVIPPDASYAAWAHKPLNSSAREPLPSYPQGWLEPAPDQAPGLVAVENRALGRVISTWLHSDLATVFPTLHGNGATVDVCHRHQISAWLRPGEKVTSGEHCVLLTEGSLETHLAAFRDIAYAETSNHPPAKPAWLKDARLLQINPRPVQHCMDQLDIWAGMGINVLYCLPVWAREENRYPKDHPLPVWMQTGNPYAMLDHYKIDEQVGTAAELKAFVRAAHDRGMKVLFDFIPQGIGVQSPRLAAFEKWMVRDRDGRPFGSHGWGPRPGEKPTVATFSMDWGDPAYRKFVTDWALWNVETFDIDGFRTDALHWKEPNLNPALLRPAYATTFGGLRLGEELSAALKKKKPDAVLLGEVWGPAFQKSHGATYENAWLLGHVNRGWLEERPFFSARTWQRHRRLSKAAHPPGRLRCNFTATHDLADLAGLAKTSRARGAVAFLHIFSEGFPFICWLEMKKDDPLLGELLRGRAALTGYACVDDKPLFQHEDLFATLWVHPEKPPVLAVANLGPQEVDEACVISHAQGPTVVSSSERVRVTPAGSRSVVRLPAFGYALLQLNPENTDAVPQDLSLTTERGNECTLQN